MAKIPFKVSARTAKLIGQENFSNAEGAIIELVKNSYDADAKKSFVIFDILFKSIPTQLSFEDYAKYSADDEFSKDSYLNEKDCFSFNTKLDKDEISKVQEYFFKKNSIYIIDNGDGMTKDIIENHWMKIGTNNKENDYITKEGRIKTGAKGIGRFALDRLGYLAEMWTLPRNNEIGYYWKMNWKQFEIPDKSISDINAELDEIKIELKQLLTDRFKFSPRIVENIDSAKFENGTVIKISNIKDEWFDDKLENIYKSLEALIPPKELKIPFGVSFFNSQQPNLFGEVETAFFDDFDYKIVSHFDSETLSVKLKITRNELDIKRVNQDFTELFNDETFPYNLKTIENKVFEINEPINDLLKWEKDDKNEKLLKDVGSFSFSFYFLKLAMSQKENYPYKEINSAERKSILDKFGGVKIYRDSFRVRPYGDTGNDWLHLGERASQSPAGPGQRIGDWRVRPNQIAGLINISRIDNKNLVDKSDRGALVENESFEILLKIIIGIINKFEYDRSRILNTFYKENAIQKDFERKEEIRKEAEKLADIIFEKRKIEEEEKERAKYEEFREEKQKQEEKEEKEEYQKIFAKSLVKFQNEEDKDAEIAQVRNLASLGLIISSFAHELKEIRNNVDEIIDLEEIFNRIVELEKKELKDFKDGTDILELLKRDGERIKHWVDYSLSAIKKDKRKRSTFKFEDYFLIMESDWEYALKDRNVDLILENDISEKYNFRAFEMDMNTVFSNLISNSIDAFKNLKTISKREIKVSYQLKNNIISITYSDNGTGLPKVFKNKVDVFLPFTTSKKDRNGKDIGTGLGMYLVKSVIDDNNGTIEFLDSSDGVKIKIEFPTRKK
jgi:signal transduction histidine kinase